MKENGEAGILGPKRLTSVLPMDTLSQESKCDCDSSGSTRQPVPSGSELPTIGALIEALGG